MEALKSATHFRHGTIPDGNRLGANFLSQGSREGCHSLSSVVRFTSGVMQSGEGQGMGAAANTSYRAVYIQNAATVKNTATTIVTAAGPTARLPRTSVHSSLAPIRPSWQ